MPAASRQRTCSRRAVPVQVSAAAVKPGQADGKADEATSAADEALATGLEAALKARAAIYVVAVGAIDARVPAVLRDATAKSGGQFLLAPEVAAVPQALRSISDALKNRYLITFMPSEPGRTGWHALDLTVRSPDLVVQAPRTLSIP